MDPNAIAQGLATAASTIGGGLLTAPAITDSIDAPYFAPTEISFDYDQTFRGGASAGLTECLYVCGIFTSRGDTDAGRALLQGYLAPDGASSLKAAIEADRTLGGAAKALIVERVRGAYRLYTIAGIDYLGAMLDVRVWA